MLFAYLDAGSGSLLLQAVLGGLAGIAVAFKAWKARFAGRKAIDGDLAGPSSEEAVLGSDS